MPVPRKFDRYAAVQPELEFDALQEVEETSEPSFEEWLEMPEFVQEDNPCFAKIVFRFETEKDLLDFSNIIGQKLTQKTKSAWHPALQRGLNAGKRWVNGK
jgi:hypothetical protein